MNKTRKKMPQKGKNLICKAPWTEERKRKKEKKKITRMKFYILIVQFMKTSIAYSLFKVYPWSANGNFE